MRLLACTFALTAVLSTALFLLAPPARAQGASFQGLGDLPGGSFGSNAYGVSDDGEVVVGTGTIDGFLVEAFRWTEATGMVGLGFVPGGDFRSEARDASADGSVVVGSGDNAQFPFEAFRWTQAGGMVGLGDLPGGSFSSEAFGVSADGQVVVGMGSGDPIGNEAFRWTQAGGMVGLGDLPGGSFDSRAFGVSADGQVVVGRSSGANGGEAFRWTQAGGMVGLGDLPGGGFSSQANDASADGSVVVGFGNGPTNNEAFRWTQAGGMVGLGDLPGHFGSAARGVSDDGSVVVGESNSGNGPVAFVWTAADGMRSLRDVLVAQGVDLTGWTLREATAVSADGRVVVGIAVNPQFGIEAFRAVLSGGHRWIDPSGGSWDIASNWSPASVPTEDDDVRFDLDATYTVTCAVPLGGTGARGARRARRLIAADGLVDFDLADLTLTATTLANPALSVSFGARAKLISGTASAFDAVVGYGASTDSTVVSRLQVFNAGTTLDVSGFLIVGLEGRGEVFVAAGDLNPLHTFIGGGTSLGGTADGVGEVIVGNEGTLDTGDISVGDVADGTLRVEEGGAVTARDVSVGGEEDVSGLVDVAGVAPSGARSRLFATDTLFVNEAGGGELSVRDGGEVTATGVLVGGDVTGFGLVTVSGVEAGERASLTANRLVVGEGRDGGLTVSAGGQVLVEDLVLGTAAGSALASVSGTAGGFRSELVATKTGLSGSCLVGDSDDEATLLFIHSGAYVRCDRAEVGDTGGGIVDVGNGTVSDSLVVSRVLTLGAGAPGVLRLQPGAVLDAVDAPRNPQQDPFDVEVEPDGRIEGSGIVVGRIENEGFVGPGLILLASAREEGPEAAARGGATGGTLLVRGAYVQAPGADLEIPLAGPDTTQQGRLRVRSVPGFPALDGSAALAGTLRLFFRDGYAPRAGDTFTLLDAAAVTGDFEDVRVLGLRPGWEFEIDLKGGMLVLTSLNDGTPTAAEPDAPGVPVASALHAPYPNPSGGRVAVAYDVAAPGRVRLAVYDLLGREVAVLVEGERAAGTHEAVLDGTRFPAGIYLVRMTAEGGLTHTRRVTLLR